MKDSARLVGLIVFFVLAAGILWWWTQDSPEPDTAPSAPPTNAASETRATQPAEAPGPVAAEPTPTASPPPMNPKGQGTITVYLSDHQGIVSGDVRVVLSVVPPSGLPQTLSEAVFPAGGRHQFTDLGRADYILRATQHESTAVKSISTTDRSRIEWEYPAELSLRPASAIAGHVVDATGRGIPGVTILPVETNPESRTFGNRLSNPSLVLRAKALSVTTDDTGAFQVPDLWDSQWILAAKADGFKPTATDPIDSGTNDVKIILNPGGVIAGTVTEHESGAPAPNIRLALSGIAKLLQAEVQSDAEGRFRFTGVPLGSYRVAVEDDRVAWAQVPPPVRVQADSKADDLTVKVSFGATVSGRVYFRETNEGLGNISLYISKKGRSYDARKPYVFTSALGRYRVSGLSPGVWTISPNENQGTDESQYNTRGFTIRGTETLSNIDIPIRMGFAVSGTVVGTAGQPVSGATLSGYPSSAGARSEKDGRFQVAGFKNTEIATISVSAKGYASRRIESVQVPSEGMRIVLEGSPGQEEGVISGIVVDTKGNLLTDAGVIAQRGSEFEDASTGKAGRFSIRVRPGEYSVYAQYRPHALMSGGTSVLTPPQTVRVAEGQRLRNVRIVVDVPEVDTDPIAGRVVDTDGQPVAGAQVLAYKRPKYGHGLVASAMTSDDGRFEIEAVLRGGEFQLEVHARGFSRGEPMEVSAGNRSVVLRLERLSAVSGRVFEAETGEPIEFFEIGHREGNRIPSNFNRYTFTSHPMGEFYLDDVPTGTSSIVARAPGFAPSSAVVNVQEGVPTTGVELGLSPAARIEGVVLDPDRRPLTGAYVFYRNHSALNPTAGDVAAFTDSEGRFWIESLPEVVTALTAGAPGYESATVPTAGVPGKTTQVEIVLGYRGGIEGAVTLAGGGLPGARVEFSHRDVHGTGQSARTDGSGRFRFHDVPACAIDLSVILLRDTIPGVDWGRITRRTYVQDGQVTREAFAVDRYNGAVEGVIQNAPAMARRIEIHVNTQLEGERRGFTGYVDESGYYHVPFIPPGTTDLSVSAYLPGPNNSSLATASVEITGGQVVRQDFDLATLFVASGSVTGLKASEHATIYVLPGHLEESQFEWDNLHDYDREGPGTISVDGDSPYALSFKTPGPYTLVVVTYYNRPDHQEGIRDIVPITASEGEQIQVDFNF